MIFFGIGPLEKFQAELHKLSRHALIALAEEMALGHSSEFMVEAVNRSRILGRAHAQIERYARFEADPDAFLLRSLNRRTAALKAARKRKREPANKKRETA